MGRPPPGASCFAAFGPSGSTSGWKLSAAARVALDVVQRELAVARANEAGVDGLDVGDDRRVGRSGVLEVQRPFDGGKVAVLDADASHHQPGLRIGIGERVFGSFVVQFARCPLQFPRFQQLGRRLAAVGEGEEGSDVLRFLPGFKPRRHPLPRLVDFGRQSAKRPARMRRKGTTIGPESQVTMRVFMAKVLQENGEQWKEDAAGNRKRGGRRTPRGVIAGTRYRITPSYRRARCA